LKKADFCINNFELIKKEIPSEVLKLLDKMWENWKDKKAQTITFSHNKYDNLWKVKWSVNIPIENQSSWTITFFEELWPIIDTLERWTVIIIDEFNSSLHPDLCEFIVNLFHSNEININNAQLIFTTHDYRLLSNKNIDRDQFWFTERNQFWASNLHSLSEYKERKDIDFQKRYFEWRYWARPFINNNI
jgi:AAA15 family ATPase/GTPase